MVDTGGMVCMFIVFFEDHRPWLLSAKQVRACLERESRAVWGLLRVRGGNDEAFVLTAHDPQANRRSSAQGPRPAPEVAATNPF